jgi:hypothetical protein
MGKLVTVEHELLRHHFHMHIAATLVRASSRLTLETECRFKIAERSPGAVIDQMPRQRTPMDR